MKTRKPKLELNLIMEKSKKHFHSYFCGVMNSSFITIKCVFNTEINLEVLIIAAFILVTSKEQLVTRLEEIMLLIELIKLFK